MSSKRQEETRLARYLLGEVSQAERERLEKEYFEDDDAFEQMLIAEDELVEAYASGELAPEERRRFEELFLASPRGRERLNFTRSLAAVSEARPAAATPEQARRAPRSTFFGALRARDAALRFALAAAALAGVVVGPTWLLVERARLRAELRQLREEHTALSEKAREMERRAATEQARGAEMLAQLEAVQARPTPEAGRQGSEAGAQPRPPSAVRPPGRPTKRNDAVLARRRPGQEQKSRLLNTADATLNNSFESRRISELPLEGRNVESLLSLGRVSFNLTPGLVRGGGANTLEVPGYATSILLKLNLERDSSHETYRAVIETAEGGVVWHIDSVVSAGGTIELPAVPARDLPPGDYVLTLSGRRPDGSLESVADYSFRIVRKTPR